uniref:Uncharacterized protein n=1 Tax=Entomoneis paludosa TaxID=265537 RepID=A0A7S2YCI4_9STRA|mmetsp:Transcript_26978/g.56501  ORF Transcript_26978/g.56501 Transcript_26978/m.56501 type:complete len:184 (+) Transcript_26978:208-759(+)|eukprot:CAMPEP_0172445786 /NCGR_PEP_ID=MMETSP1065-20121228/5573_1 /TAXON_ID=265537 /ORGANISM="Amphiprora paludosa, Strain CCMP125" /LENGTH=183 /DNA_ID=CAMNT_0013196769 /DNA_START=190 /DNA_END=741 /DNA_ORIENTATION=+
MKSVLALFLLSLFSTTLAFAPVRPVHHQSIHSGVGSKNALFMASDDKGSTGLLEKTETTQSVNGSTENVGAVEEEKEKSETEKLLEKIKASGKAGVISYALWELAFWFVSIPIAVFGYLQVSGHWPDFNNSDDVAGVGAEAFAFVNFARFAVPLRIGLALSSVGFVQENIVDRFFPEEEKTDE